MALGVDALSLNPNSQAAAQADKGIDLQEGQIR